MDQGYRSGRHAPARLIRKGQPLRQNQRADTRFQRQPAGRVGAFLQQPQEVIYQPIYLNSATIYLNSAPICLNSAPFCLNSAPKQHTILTTTTQATTRIAASHILLHIVVTATFRGRATCIKYEWKGNSRLRLYLLLCTFLFPCAHPYYYLK